jgi:demethylmenaquinone methyltransferase / 2-methoxy-6-polyprenyl-1,4-benzoquinol methylase
MTVPQMFDTISKQYDFINKVLSLGLDTFWRYSLVKQIPSRYKLRLLDCATGTGDLLLTLLERCPNIYDSVGLDPADQMLEVARKKLISHSHHCRLVSGCGEMIPFPDGTFDVATCAFGIRNVVSVSKTLSELHRTLSHDGRLIILEFSHPSQPAIRWLHRHYLKHVVPRVGSWLSNNIDAYSYLSKTIETFPQGQVLAEMIYAAGFKNVQIKPLTCGVVSLYIGDKK